MLLYFYKFLICPGIAGSYTDIIFGFQIFDGYYLTTMENEFKKTQLHTIILFSTLILVITLYIILLLTGRSNIFMRENAASLVSASNRQMELNIDSYLNKVQKASALLFSNNVNYTYDPTKKDADPYTQLQISNQINDNITDLSLLDNYADFALIYQNDEVIGSLSKLTKICTRTAECMMPSAAFSNRTTSMAPGTSD